jgi:hypothetical protein
MTGRTRTIAWLLSAAIGTVVTASPTAQATDGPPVIVAGGSTSLPALSVPFIDYQRLIVVGDPNGTPPDSPDLHVDANVPTSPLAGIGSIQNDLGNGMAYLGSGALIDRLHVLTAAHLFDTNGDGHNDFALSKTSFILNSNGDYTAAISASAVHIHPDFTGFNNPSVNDDLAIITLSQPVPADVPVYGLWRQPVAQGQTVSQVGYGRSGNGVTGYTTSASWTVKRIGSNQMDDGGLDDEGSGAIEVWYADFDDPTGTGHNFLGGESLGNTIETILGPGDSGGPSSVSSNGALYIVGNDTFVGRFDLGPDPPYFDSGMGGMLVYPYLNWIDSVVPEPATLTLLALGGLAVLRRRMKSRR